MTLPHPSVRLAGMDETTLDNAAGRFSLLLSEPRRVIGLGVVVACLGLIVGYRLAAGADTFPPPPNPFGGPVPPVPHDCAKCRERAIREQLAAEVARNAADVARASSEIHDEALAEMPTGIDPPAPLLDLDPVPVPFDHSRPAPSATTFSAMATPAAGAPIGVPKVDN